jgi:hypothetical protein
MGILGYAEVDAAAMGAQDEAVAEEFDARRAEIERIARRG